MSGCKNAEKAAVIGLFSLHRNGRAGRQGNTVPQRYSLVEGDGICYFFSGFAMLSRICVSACTFWSL